MFDTVLKIIGNYLLIQVSIVLFILPFYWLYRRKYLPDGEFKVNFNQHLEYFFSSKYANWLVFFWAMGEALVWFIIPEFLLVLLVFMRIRRKRELLYYDIYGTAAGTLAAFIIPIPASLLDKIPYVQPSMVSQAEYWFSKHGILALAYQPFSGVPYKVFTHLAPNYHFFIGTFLVFAVIVRISRYYIIYLLASGIYPFLHKYVYRNYARLFVVATFIFSLLLLRIYTSWGHHQVYPASLSKPLTFLNIKSERWLNGYESSY